MSGSENVAPIDPNMLTYKTCPVFVGPFSVSPVQLSSQGQGFVVYHSAYPLMTPFQQGAEGGGHCVPDSTSLNYSPNYSQSYFVGAQPWNFAVPVEEEEQQQEPSFNNNNGNLPVGYYDVPRSFGDYCCYYVPLTDKAVQPPAAEEHSNNRRNQGKRTKSKSSKKNFQPLTTERGIFCKLCRSNGESAEIYADHMLKNAKGEVTCPVLQKYVCPVCGQTGTEAHTLKYCPLRKPEKPFVYKKVLNSAGRICTLKY